MVASGKQHWPLRGTCPECRQTDVGMKLGGRMRDHIDGRVGYDPRSRPVRCSAKTRRPDANGPAHQTYLLYSRNQFLKRWACRCGARGNWCKDAAKATASGVLHARNRNAAERAAALAAWQAGAAEAMARIAAAGEDLSTEPDEG